MNIKNSLTAYRITQITAALTERAQTVDDIALEIGLCRAHLARYLAELHAAGAIYIASWAVRQQGRATRLPVYRLGARPDAQRPANLTQRERQAAHKARIYADPERHDRYKALGRARKLRVKRDPLVVAMFGAAGGAHA
ncbi:hypothetical protein [Duganella callida]|uniref:Uncharacterized protein n=1 Tax=Duganella callida TaxID=2561932 RepID=A0A4Y9S8S3_9BURK|nr:hypothetical protein [Duganella callida]TFW15946.1 hypothetical protein E4L98_24945 [Duganella callida]